MCRGELGWHIAKHKPSLSNLYVKRRFSPELIEIARITEMPFVSNNNSTVNVTCLMNHVQWEYISQYHHSLHFFYTFSTEQKNACQMTISQPLPVSLPNNAVCTFAWQKLKQTDTNYCHENMGFFCWKYVCCPFWEYKTTIVLSAKLLYNSLGRSRDLDSFGFFVSCFNHYILGWWAGLNFNTTIITLRYVYPVINICSSPLHIWCRLVIWLQRQQTPLLFIRNCRWCPL